MADYKKYINALRKCANEHENDRTSTGHIIVSDLCRDTANLLEEIEQEPILNKIKAEITAYDDLIGHNAQVQWCLKVIDKHKAESEVKNDKL